MASRPPHGHELAEWSEDSQSPPSLALEFWLGSSPKCQAREKTALKAAEEDSTLTWSKEAKANGEEL